MQSRVRRLLPAFAAVVLATTVISAELDKKPKPSVSLRASPQVGFSPLRVVLTAELTGGVDDFEEYYCPAVEWYWGDDTKSESKVDCDPYEAGKSEIKRRYTVDHTFNTMGEYRVEFRLKQKNKVVGGARTTIRVRPGIRDGQME
jgi:hypothetical protein